MLSVTFSPCSKSESFGICWNNWAVKMEWCQICIPRNKIGPRHLMCTWWLNCYIFVHWLWLYPKLILWDHWPFIVMIEPTSSYLLIKTLTNFTSCMVVCLVLLCVCVFLVFIKLINVSHINFCVFKDGMKDIQGKSRINELAKIE